MAIASEIVTNEAIDGGDIEGGSTSIGGRTVSSGESARRPLPHSEEVPVPTFCSTRELSFESNFSNMKSGSDFGGTASIKPKTFIQEEVNYLIRDLDLPKESAEILAFKLREKNCWHWEQK
ncbi:hypothetical protein EVAR_74522_1 [Eumeta japonica]|uniref:Uncharacterized protein n=1 Tax=Eumeta variegata TaxID=151549 RepID=A0A4C1TEK9_EUMVA|nr:hypothetical protein EVAR_74522_1 [Eumeta japonica]